MATAANSVQIGTPPMQRGGWLDALRFITACLIVLYHFQDAAPVPLQDIHPLFARGYLLTNFFLIDSGYVLARIYSERIAAGDMSTASFFRKRFLRVVPAHLIMSTVLVGLVVASDVVGIDPRHPEWFDWSQLPAQILLLQSYGVPGGTGWNAPTWSISALLGCYLAFPMMIRIVRRLTGLQALVLGVALYLAADALALAVLKYPVYEMPLRYGIWRALPLFMSGMMLARISETIVIAPRLAGLMGVGAALALLLIQFTGDHSLLSLGLIGVVIVAAGAIPVLKPSRWIAKASLASFSIFITNEVVRIGWIGLSNALASRFAWSETVQWGLWAGGLGLALAFAFSFYALVDAPSQVVIQRGMARRTAALRKALADRLPQPRGLDLADRPTPRGYVELVLDKGPLRVA